MITLSIHHLRTHIGSYDRTNFIGVANGEFDAQTVLDVTDEQPFIYSLYVHEAHRGKGLLMAVLTEAKAQALRSIALQVHHQNEAAIALYKSFDFFTYTESDAYGLVSYGLSFSDAQLGLFIHVEAEVKCRRLYFGVTTHSTIMPTSNYGGQGAPDYNESRFTVLYTERREGAAPQEKMQKFSRFDEAEAFYHSIDDSAFLWDHTRSSELCEGKTYVAK